MKYLRETDLVWPALILVFNEANDLLELNSSAEDFFSMMTAKERITDLILPEEHKKWQKTIDELRPGVSATFPLTLLNHDLEPIRFKVSVTKSLREPILYLMATNIQDVVDLEQTYSQGQQKSILESRLFALAEMAQGLAHEINNPLAILMANIAVLERELKDSKNDTEKTLRVTQQIATAGLRIAEVIKGLRKVCKSETDEPKRLNTIRGMIDHVLGLRAESMKSAGIQVTLSDFPEHEVLCHPAQLMQVFMNLLNNSFDAVQNLSEKWIKIEVKIIFEMLEISVIDSGHGLKPDISDKIMQPFFSTKEVGKGMGLGLNISKAIVEDHEGRLYYDRNCPNTRFVIQLPLRKGASLIAISADDAIAAHLGWRQRLTQHFLVTDPSLDPKIIAQDSKCSLGMWIYGSESRYGHMPCFQNLRKTHAQFHLCTAHLVERQQNLNHAVPAKSSQEHAKLQAEISEGSEFDLLSKKIVSLISLVKSQIEKEKLDQTIRP